MLSFIERIVYGPNKQLKNADLEKLAERNPFSAFLNYNAYSREHQIYVNLDQSLGLLWECSPRAFASAKTITALEGLFRSGLPGGSIVQIILHADPHIAPLLEWYKRGITAENPVIKNNVEKIVDFLNDGRDGLAACADIPIRNFRLMVAVKIPGDSPNIPKPEEFAKKGTPAFLENIQRQIEETLKGASLYPRAMHPEQLLEWLRRMFNSYPEGYPEHNFSAYDDHRPMRMQIINGDTVIKENSEALQVGDKHFFILTPKSLPKQVDPLQTNSLFGGIWGLTTDMDQIKTGFLYTLNILFDDGVNMQIRTKCSFLLNQKGFGSLSAKLYKKQGEFLKAVDDMEHGGKFVRIVPELLIWSNTPQKAHESCTRAVRLWENQGYVMQQETILRKVLFLSALPFCFYNQGKNIQLMERDFIAPTQSILPLLPVQGDFIGSLTPRLLFIGRKGQLIPLDFFDTGTINYNGLCAASSGSGKSFLVNYIIFNYFASGAFVRVIDIGGSYKKIADMLGGVYLDFQKETKICLNPFTNIIEPDEELAAVSAVFAQMTKANSSTEKCTPTEENLIKAAVRWAWDQKGHEADADTVYEFLHLFPELPGTDFPDMAANIKLTAAAKDLAFNIREFTSKGVYGKFFIGPSTFDIRRDPFVVLELENLKPLPDLYRVVTMLVINGVTQDLYLSDRSRQKFVIFEEAWQFLGEAAMIKPVVEEGYRRARKYNGSFMVVVQSIVDLDSFGDVGKVINHNSAYKMFLESGAIEDAQKRGIIDYDTFTLKLLKSCKSNPPKYSEIFFDTPFGCGVARLVVNDYAYFVYTSNATEIAAIEGLVKKDGLTYHEAIMEMVQRKQQHR
jgi:conjugal transfer ATP-binding protein TraC